MKNKYGFFFTAIYPESDLKYSNDASITLFLKRQQHSKFQICHTTMKFFFSSRSFACLLDTYK